MPDFLHCAIMELKRRKLRTLTGLAGYLFAIAFLVCMLLLLRYDLQAKNATVNYMGNKFLAFAPHSPLDTGDTNFAAPLDPQNEGFFAEPNVVTRQFSAILARQIAKIPEVDAVTPMLLFRCKNGQDGHIFSIAGIRPADRHALRGTLINPEDIISGVFFRSEDRNVVLVDKSYADLWNLKTGSVVNVGGTLYPIIGIVGSQARVTRADIYMNWPDAEAAINRRLKRPLDNEANIFLIETSGAETTRIAMKKVQDLLQSGLTRAVICSIPAVKFLNMSHGTLKMVLAAVAVLVLLLTMNLHWAAVAERRHEIAILKAIGWKDLFIFLQLVVESVLVAVCGSLAGVAGGYAAFAVAAARLGSRLNPAYAVLDVPVTIAAALILAASLGAIAALLPAIRAVMTRPAEVLRTL